MLSVEIGEDLSVLQYGLDVAQPLDGRVLAVRQFHAPGAARLLRSHNTGGHNKRQLEAADVAAGRTESFIYRDAV